MSSRGHGNGKENFNSDEGHSYDRTDSNLNLSVGTSNLQLGVIK